MPITVETGSMFSGKSGAVVEAVKRRLIGNQVDGRDFLVFNHSSDNRYGEGIVSSHYEQKVRAIALSSSLGLLGFLVNIPKPDWELESRHVKPNYINLKALYLDEAQFFDNNLGRVLEMIDLLYLALVPKRTLDIVVAGLDMDFRGEPFGPMPDIMARATRVNKHVAVCSICGENNATRTQRLVNGNPPRWDDPVVIVGAQELYTARCPEHHEVIGRNVNW